MDSRGQQFKRGDRVVIMIPFYKQVRATLEWYDSARELWALTTDEKLPNNQYSAFRKERDMTPLSALDRLAEL